MSLRNILMVASLALSVLIGWVISHGGALGGLVGRDRGGAGNAGSGHKITIGVSFDTLTEERWQRDCDLLKKRIEELGGVMKFAAANGDDRTQIQDIKSLLAGNIDVLIIVPHNGQAMAQAVAEAHRARVPVIAYDRLIMNCDLDLYASFDAIHVGEVQARYLMDHLPPTGKKYIVRIWGSRSDNNAELFKQGQNKVLDPYYARGEIDYVQSDYATDWRPDEAKKITNAAIANATAKGIKIEGILASNDGTAGGAIEALPANSSILVTGQDADKLACQRIVKGTQTMTVYKPLRVLARSAAEAAVHLAEHKPVVAGALVNNGKIDVPSILNEVVAVDKNNMMEAIVKDGFLSYDDVYGALPESQRPPRPQGR